jgi:hypothetical protein
LEGGREPRSPKTGYFISAITPDTEINNLIHEALLKDDRVQNILAMLPDRKTVKD